jgi:hypothetical protein
MNTIEITSDDDRDLHLFLLDELGKRFPPDLDIEDSEVARDLWRLMHSHSLCWATER